MRSVVALGVAAVAALAAGCGQARTPLVDPLPTISIPIGSPSPSSSPSSGESPNGEPSDEPGAGADDGGYTADPYAYLTTAQRERLQNSGLPMLAPTWLPDWTADAGLSIIEPSSEWHLIGLSWDIEWTGQNGHPLTVRFGGELFLHLFVAETNAGKLAHIDEPEERVGENRAYHWHPDNDQLCSENGTAESEDSGDAGEEPIGYIEWDDTSGTYYYQLQLLPRPGCWGELSGSADLLRIAESVVPINS